MSNTLKEILYLFIAIISLISGNASGAKQLTPSKEFSRLIFPDSEGKLAYQSFSEQGDVIPDFSMCGYMGGGVRIPDVATVITLRPSSGRGDDSKRIQRAINHLSSQPLTNGFRGAVLLKKGKYRIDEYLMIKASGVILRGEGQGERGTVLFAASKKKYDVIRIEGRPSRGEGGEVAVLDSYVPIGAKQLTVQNASKFQVGDEVLVTRPGSKAWLEKLGMDRLTEVYNDPDLVNWTPESYTFMYDRRITAIDGNRLTLDAPIVEPLDERYGGGWIEKRVDQRTEQCGIENLRIISAFDKSKRKSVSDAPDIFSLIDLEHAQIGVKLSNTKDCWVRRVTVQHVAQTAVRISQSIRVTVQDCAMIDPVGVTKGGTKYSFVNAGQLCLFQRLYSRNARHDYTLTPRIGGPNVFLHCFSDGSLTASESHHRYGHGALFDSCILRGKGIFLAVNRGKSGSGHGWSSGMIIFWNCGAVLTAVMAPPTSQNFSIGWSGLPDMPKQSERCLRSVLSWLKAVSLQAFEYEGVPVLGDGYIEFPDRLVKPHSLYLQQLRDRLGVEAVKNIAVPWQWKALDFEKSGRINEPIFRLSP